MQVLVNFFLGSYKYSFFYKTCLDEIPIEFIVPDAFGSEFSNSKWVIFVYLLFPILYYVRIVVIFYVVNLKVVKFVGECDSTNKLNSKYTL